MESNGDVAGFYPITKLLLKAIILNSYHDIRLYRLGIIDRPSANISHKSSQKRCIYIRGQNGNMHRYIETSINFRFINKVRNIGTVKSKLNLTPTIHY